MDIIFEREMNEIDIHFNELNRWYKTVEFKIFGVVNLTSNFLLKLAASIGGALATFGFAWLSKEITY